LEFRAAPHDQISTQAGRTVHFSLDMKINQSYSLLTKIQTFE
jgi:hypothetical protein